MTDTEEIEKYQEVLEEALQRFCDATRIDSAMFDGDDDDFTLYARCFEMMAGALEKHGIVYHVETDEFFQPKEAKRQAFLSLQD